MESSNSRIHKIQTDCGAQVLAWAALVVPVLAIFLGLSLDVGYLYDIRRRAQSAADGAASSGAMELARGKSGLVNDTSLLDAKRNGFDDDESGITVTVNHPPLNGPRAADTNFVEVIVAEDVDTYFMEFVYPGLVTVRARSVAGIVAFGDACVMALDPTANQALKVNGNPTLNANCGVMVNSSDSNAALAIPGSDATINATYVGVTGGYSGSGAINPTPETGVVPMVDPLAYMQPLDPASYPPGARVGDTFYPGVYDSEIKISGNKNITFEPGIYILRGGMKISGGTVSGFGVSFFLTDEGGSIDIAGSSDVTFTAPASGPMQGMLFFAHPNATGTNRIGRGTSTFKFQGSTYFPGAHLDWAGTPLGDGSNGVLIANTLDISGTSDIDITNPDPDNGGATLMKATIVE